MAPVSIDMNYISTRLSYPAFWLGKPVLLSRLPAKKTK